MSWVQFERMLPCRVLLPTKLLLAFAIFPDAACMANETIGLKANRYFIDILEREINAFFAWRPDFPKLIAAHRGGGFLPGFPENILASMDHTDALVQPL